MNNTLNTADILDIDKKHIWHPYSSVNTDNPLYVVKSAQGVHIHLTTGEKLIDGMSSWWSTLHGYNHPALNRAVTEQLNNMAHVMFGGLTHAPAAKLTAQLIAITPSSLEHVFFSDSGSVAVEVAMKMAIQYWQSKGEHRAKFLSLKKGYHGDTFAAMSVSDPVTGMHHVFSEALPKQLFAEQPSCTFGNEWDQHDFDHFESLFLEHKEHIAGVILEPIVQGTGGMHFYHPNYLSNVRKLTADHGVPLIADEIATGLGRTGKLFACEHADISPDIMCLGKTLSAGYITLAATLCSSDIATTICNGEAGVFMHGPTFMANPLACAVASKSLELLFENDWPHQVAQLEKHLKAGLEACHHSHAVKDVRVLGGIGVVEMHERVDLNLLQPEFIKNGIWLRPFGHLIYMLPPFISTADDIKTLCNGIVKAINAVY